MANDIKLPKLRENVESVEVTEVLVAPGQVVAKDQPLLVVNADKANMEVVAPVAGRVVKLNVKVGDEIKIGHVYCSIEGNGEAAAPPAAKKEPPPEAPKAPPARKEPAPEAPRTAPAKRAAPAVAAPAPARGGDEHDLVLAGPATRWLARKLGI